MLILFATLCLIQKGSFPWTAGQAQCRICRLRAVSLWVITPNCLSPKCNMVNNSINDFHVTLGSIFLPQSRATSALPCRRCSRSGGSAAGSRTPVHTGIQVLAFPWLGGSQWQCGHGSTGFGTAVTSAWGLRWCWRPERSSALPFP